MDDDSSHRAYLEGTAADLEPDLELVDTLRSTFDAGEAIRRIGRSGSMTKMVLIARECSLEILQALFTRGGVECLIAPFSTGRGRDYQTAL